MQDEASGLRPFRTLGEAGMALRAWLREAALPLWSVAGVDARNGGFRDALSPEGEPLERAMRSRSQTRQVWVFLTAAELFGDDRWRRIAARGMDFYLQAYRRADGLFVRAVAPDGVVADPAAAVYEQAFSLLALAAAARAGIHPRAADIAHEALAGMAALRSPSGGFVEADPQPFQANCHMHLLEAALAWEALGSEPFAALADEVAALALERFIARPSAMVLEFFDAAWSPIAETAGGRVEPGHQFEWAWLLREWASRRGRPDVGAIAAALYEAGGAGMDRAHDMAVNAIWTDRRVRDGGARLWAQAERLKAAVLFDRPDDALSAARGLAGFLETPAAGAWWDRWSPDGGFVREPARATSLYHIVDAMLPLLAAR